MCYIEKAVNSVCVCSALLQAAQVVSTEQPDKKKGGKGKGKGASSGKVSPHHTTPNSSPPPYHDCRPV